MPPLTPHWPQPSHPTLIAVTQSPNPSTYTSGATSLVSLPAGSLFTPITTATSATRATYSTVQIGADKHIELNSDLLYCNHSCAPSLEFDMGKFEVRVARDRDLKEGDALTFFYPSTEWDMAQPFRCECAAGEGRCLGWIKGAAWLEGGGLGGYWLNEHVRAGLEGREAEERKTGGRK